MFNKMGNRLTVVFVSLAIIPLVVLAIFLGGEIFELSISDSISDQSVLAEQYNIAISNAIFARADELALFGETFGFEQLDQSQQYNLISNFLVNRSAYEQITVVNTDGSERLKVSRFDVILPSDLGNSADNPVFQGVLATQSIQFSNVYFDRNSGEPLLTIGVPITDLRTGEIGSILIAEFRFRLIWEIVEDLQREQRATGGETFSAYLTDAEDIVVAHANPSVVLSRSQFEAPSENGQATGLSGNSVILTSQTLSIGNVDFSLITEENTNDVLRPAYDILNLIGLISAVTLIVTASAVGVTVRRIVKPIVNLNEVSTALASGNLSERVTITSRDEIGQLGESFNKMAAAIEYRDQVQITQLKDQLYETEKARAQAERSDQVKSAFLASMSHELRTPLNAVINFTKFVAKGDLGPVNQEQEETLNEVVDSAKHLLNLINDVLDMSKIDSGSLNLFIQDNVSVTEILNTATSMGRSLLAGKQVDLQLDVPADLPTIRADKQRILQILLNIMSNACKFTETGSINVKATHRHDEVVIAIKDTGPGIAQEDQPLVFEAFKQTSSGLQQGTGTGLGMPISKHLAEVHGGRLWLESQPGQGSTFYVALPIKSEELIPLVLA